MTDTQFAPAERAGSEELYADYKLFTSSSVLDSVLSKVDQYIIVLNMCRQVVYANAAFMHDFGFQGIEDVIGGRVGELLDCRFSCCVNGCGTSEFCRECGAVRSMLESQQKHDNIKECVILTKNSKTIDLAVCSKYLEIHDREFTLFSFTDISDKHNMEAVEDILYHDISNLASSMQSMLKLLNDDRIQDKSKIKLQLMRNADELMNELASHKVLKLLKNERLEANMARLNSLHVVHRAINLIDRFAAARGVILYIHHTSADFEFISDPSLLNRVLINMLTNAVEASSFSQKVTAGCDIKDSEKIFWVHNQTFMEPDIQGKVFRTKFSTKKNGSGYGTQSIRLLTESYLNGRVSFSSVPEEGTVFNIFLP